MRRYNPLGSGPHLSVDVVQGAEQGDGRVGGAGRGLDGLQQLLEGSPQRGLGGVSLLRVGARLLVQNAECLRSPKHRYIQWVGAFVLGLRLSYGSTTTQRNDHAVVNPFSVLRRVYVSGPITALAAA